MLAQAMRRHSRSLLIVLLGVLLLPLGVMGTAAADEPAIKSVTVDAKLGADGVLTVSETIDFETPPRLFMQRLAIRRSIEQNHWFNYEVTVLSAAVNGESTEVSTSQDGDDLLVKIEADGGTKIELVYQVVGATRQHDQLVVTSWPMVQGLDRPIGSASGVLRIPATPELIDCTAGAPSALDKCTLYAAGTHDHPMPTFEQRAIPTGGEVYFTVGAAEGIIAVTANISEGWSLDRAFRATPVTAGLALLMLLAGAGILYLLFRRVGYDNAYDGALDPIALFEPTGVGQSVFTVTDGIRPGHVGTVVDERVDPIDVTASLLDLAVRGHLRITELPREGHELLDWRLSRRDGADELRGFEDRLLAAVVPDGNDVLVSQLPAQLTPQIPDLQSELYDDVVARGWFDSRPDATRNKWRLRGMVGLGLAVVAAALLIAETTFGLLGLVLVLLAAGLLWIADRMPRRTVAGAKLLGQMDALSALLATQPTDQLPPGREITEISKILPYTVVLGSRERWLQALRDADPDAAPDPDKIDWYHAPADWHLKDFPASITAFIHTVQGELFDR